MGDWSRCCNFCEFFEELLEGILCNTFVLKLSFFQCTADNVEESESFADTRLEKNVLVRILLDYLSSLGHVNEEASNCSNPCLGRLDIINLRFNQKRDR